MRRLTLAEIVASVAADSLDGAAGSLTIDRVTTDSRHVRPGDLFWALAGERFDGHEFVAQAFAAGAAAAVVRCDFVGQPFQADKSAQKVGLERPTYLLRVDDTKLALGRFAAWYRRTCQALVIAVTGSVGKTSTREAIYAVLSRRWQGVRSLKNFNNDIGVPLSLLELEPEHQFAVIELGASGPGEIARLTEIVAPRIGVLTAIGSAHLEGFGSIEGVARAKAELIAGLGKNGIAVLNGDDARVQAVGEAARCGVLWYGTRAGTYGLFARGHDIETAGETTWFRLDAGRLVKLAAPGRHQVYAALAAIVVGRWMGMADREIAAGLENYRPAAMRCQVERLGGVTVINDAYNASPPSMWAALEMLATWPTKGRRVLVCGDMLELGRYGPEMHRRLGDEIARRMSIDYCIAVGPLSAVVVDAARKAGKSPESIMHCESVEQAAEFLRQNARDGDVVLVKASRAMQLERVVAGIPPRSAA